MQKHGEPAGPDRAIVGSAGQQIEVLFDAAAIENRVAALAEEISAAGFRDLLVVPILTGSFIFAADLIRALHGSGLAPEIDFLSLASYGLEKESSGRIEILRDLEAGAAERDILIIDDILDTGRTLAFAKDLLVARRARRVATCVMLDKKSIRSVDIEADFRGFECPDSFVVGYGMDLAHRFRELPFIGRIM